MPICIKFTNTTFIATVISLGPHCAYFRMRTLKPQVAKVSTVASVMRDK